MRPAYPIISPKDKIFAESVSTDPANDEHGTEEPRSILDSKKCMAERQDPNTISRRFTREYAKTARNVMLAGAEGVYAYGLLCVCPLTTPGP